MLTFKILEIASKLTVIKNRLVFVWDRRHKEGQTAKSTTNLLDEEELCCISIVAVLSRSIEPR